MNKDFKDVLNNMSDIEVKEAVFECLEDEKRDDGIIQSKWVRKIAKEYSIIGGQNNTMFLTTAIINIYKEGCKRFIK